MLSFFKKIKQLKLNLKHKFSFIMSFLYINTKNVFMKIKNKTKKVLISIKRGFCYVFDRYKKNKEYFISFIIALSILLLLYISMCNLSGLVDALIPSVVKFEDTLETFLSILITILGFSITIRNMLISRETSKYKNFSLKRIIANSSNYLNQVLWYIILLAPVDGIILYVFGYQKQIIIIVFLSIVCMIVYFWLTLRRLKDNHVQDVLAEILLNDLLCENHNTYRRDIIKKLCLLDDFNTSINDSYMVFNLFLKKLKYICKKCPKKTPFTSTIKNINIRLICNGKKKIKQFKKQKIKKTYFYSLDFFGFFISENLRCNKEHLTEYVLSFLKQCDEIIISEEMRMNKVLTNDSLLYLNIIFGVIQSCFQYLNFEVVKNILEEYLEYLKTKSFDAFFLIDYINALIVLSINYLLCHEKLNGNVEIGKILDYYTNKSIRINENELKTLLDVLIENDKELICVLNSIIDQYKINKAVSLPIYFKE